MAATPVTVLIARVELANGEEGLPTSSLTRLMAALSKTHARLKEWPSLIEEDIFGKYN